MREGVEKEKCVYICRRIRVFFFCIWESRKCGGEKMNEFAEECSYVCLWESRWMMCCWQEGNVPPEIPASSTRLDFSELNVTVGRACSHFWDDWYPYTRWIFKLLELSLSLWEELDALKFLKIDLGRCKLVELSNMKVWIPAWLQKLEHPYA